jgi:hypothetical protein
MSDELSSDLINGNFSAHASAAPRGKAQPELIDDRLMRTSAEVAVAGDRAKARNGSRKGLKEGGAAFASQ